MMLATARIECISLQWQVTGLIPQTRFFFGSSCEDSNAEGSAIHAGEENPKRDGTWCFSIGT